MGYFMPVAESVAEWFFLTIFLSLIIDTDKLVKHTIRPSYFLILVSNTRDK